MGVTGGILNLYFYFHNFMLLLDVKPWDKPFV